MFFVYPFFSSIRLSFPCHVADRDHVKFKKEDSQNGPTEACRAEGEDVIRANSEL